MLLFGISISELVGSLFLDKQSPGNASCCPVVPLWARVDSLWMQQGVLTASASVCKPLTILYLTTS